MNDATTPHFHIKRKNEYEKTKRRSSGEVKVETWKALKFRIVLDEPHEYDSPRPDESVHVSGPNWHVDRNPAFINKIISKGGVRRMIYHVEKLQSTCAEIFVVDRVRKIIRIRK